MISDIEHTLGLIGRSVGSWEGRAADGAGETTDPFSTGLRAPGGTYAPGARITPEYLYRNQYDWQD